MNVQQFIKESGFKVLAMARLDRCEYSIVLYILNCAVSGLDQIITTEQELASLIGYDERTVRDALNTLSSRNIVRLYFGDVTHTDRHSCRLALQYDMTKWNLGLDKEINSKDAIVFPFVRQGKANLQVVDGLAVDKEEKTSFNNKIHLPTWKRVFESFVHNRTMDDDEINKTEEVSRLLVDTHPVDQVLLMIRHFGNRIPTLSLLASSWSHYHEIFEHETQKVDMLGARQKHIELDDKLREKSLLAIEKADSLNLNEEERTVLNILVKHRHPRRQLFWAYQMRSRYPNLSTFFDDNIDLMLPVTSTGTVVKRPLFE